MRNSLRLLFLLCLSLLGSSPSQAQATNTGLWCPLGARWAYLSAFWGGIGQTTVEYARDTLVAGRWGQVLLNSGGRKLVTVATPDVVQVYDNNQFYTLYDFAAQPGARWTTIVRPLVQSGPCTSTIDIVVDAVGQSMYAGRLRRWFTSHVVGAGSSGTYGFQGTVYEGIGPVSGNNFLIPIARQGNPCWYVDGPSLMGLQCYSTRASGATLGTGCGPAPTAVKAATEAQFAIYPNPTSGVLHAELARPGQAATCTVQELSGRRLLREALPANGQLDLSSLSPGTYLLSVAQAGQATFHQRIVRE